MINHFLDDSISGNMGAACTEEHFCINRTRSRYVRWVTCVGWRCKYEIVRVPTLRRVMRYKCIVTGERAICEETIYGSLDQVEDHQPPPGYLVFDALSLSLSLFSPLISFAYQSVVPRITARMMKPVARDRDINPDQKISSSREERRDVRISTRYTTRCNGFRNMEI